MGYILRNPRHELYAQGIAAGLSRKEASLKAGFKGLVRITPAITQRVTELLRNSAKRSEFSRKEVLDRIVQDWDLGRKLGQVSSALKAAELYGKEVHKMFVDRREVGGPGDFDGKSEEELRQIIQDEIKDLGWDADATIPPDKSLN
jgi:hypothetical protein